MFSGSTLGALTSAQESAGGPRQQIDAVLANRMVSQLDADGDGSLSLSEIETALGGSSGAAGSSGVSGSSSSTSAGSSLAGAFAAVDANGDGQLSAQELTDALNQMQGPGQGLGEIRGHQGHHRHGDGDDVAGAAAPTSTAASGDASTTSGIGSTGTGDATTSTGVASSNPSSTSTNTVSTLDGLTSADVAQAVQAFLNSLAQSQAANLSALAPSAGPTNVTA